MCLVFSTWRFWHHATHTHQKHDQSSWNNSYCLLQPTSWTKTKNKQRHPRLCNPNIWPFNPPELPVLYLHAVDPTTQVQPPECCHPSQQKEKHTKWWSEEEKNMNTNTDCLVSEPFSACVVDFPRQIRFSCLPLLKLETITSLLYRNETIHTCAIYLYKCQHELFDVGIFWVEQMPFGLNDPLKKH